MIVSDKRFMRQDNIWASFGIVLALQIINGAKKCKAVAEGSAGITKTYEKEMLDKPQRIRTKGDYPPNAYQKILLLSIARWKD